MTCATCHGEGFIVRGTNVRAGIDVCPICVIECELAYQERHGQSPQMALVLQFSERLAA